MGNDEANNNEQFTPEEETLEPTIDKVELNPEYEEVKIETIKYEEVKTDKEKKNKNGSYYDGKVIELIGYNILRILITIFSLGFAKPWADCMVMSYKINHTVLNGERLKFAGTGSSLFVQKFKWILLSIITFGIYAWIVPLKKIEWIVSYIHFEGKEFIRGESTFRGKLFPLIGINLLCGIINAISLSIARPFTYCIKAKWVAKHSIFSKRKIVFNGKSLDLFIHYIIWGLLSVITLGIFLLWFDIKKMNWFVSKTHIKIVGEEEEKIKFDPLVILFITVFVIVTWVVLAIIGKSILFKEPENVELHTKEIETAVYPAFTEMSERYHNGERQGSGYIKELNSISEFTKLGAKGTYWYEEQGIDDNYIMVIEPIYKRYLCYKDISAYTRGDSYDRPMTCTYMNIPNILENPNLIIDYLEARFENFSW